jgi:hypothetical protein
MEATPEETAVTMPEEPPTVAMAVLLLLQVPPGVLFDKLVVPPTQTVAAPEMNEGDGLTVSTAVAESPVE